MSAYATLRKSSALHALPAPLTVHAVPSAAPGQCGPQDPISDQALVDLLVARIADRVAATVAAHLTAPIASGAPEWLDSRAAAEYLGLHRDTLRKLAAERAIPAEQDGPGCKLFFLWTDLDQWRRDGGRASHLASAVAA